MIRLKLFSFISLSHDFRDCYMFWAIQKVFVMNACMSTQQFCFICQLCSLLTYWSCSCLTSIYMKISYVGVKIYVSILLRNLLSATKLFSSGWLCLYVFVSSVHWKLTSGLKHWLFSFLVARCHIIVHLKSKINQRKNKNRKKSRLQIHGHPRMYPKAETEI